MCRINFLENIEVHRLPPTQECGKNYNGCSHLASMRIDLNADVGEWDDGPGCGD